MNDEILDFIHRRFPEDSHWTDGNCYYFAIILLQRFRHCNLHYDVINGHFLVYFYNEDAYYDYTGRVYPDMGETEDHVIYFQSLYYEDPDRYYKILEDCIM